LRKLAGGASRRNPYTKSFSSGGAAEGFGSPQITLVEIDTTTMQEFQIFLLKGPIPVMLLLPCKGAVVGLIMNPFRGNRLDVANHIGEAGFAVLRRENDVEMGSMAWRQFPVSLPGHGFISYRNPVARTTG
jgi:hypothetical protein